MPIRGCGEDDVVMAVEVVVGALLSVAPVFNASPLSLCPIQGAA